MQHGVRTGPWSQGSCGPAEHDRGHTVETFSQLIGCGEPEMADLVESFDPG